MTHGSGASQMFGCLIQFVVFRIQEIQHDSFSQRDSRLMAKPDVYWKSSCDAVFSLAAHRPFGKCSGVDWPRDSSRNLARGVEKSFHGAPGADASDDYSDGEGDLSSSIYGAIRSDHPIRLS